MILLRLISASIRGQALSPIAFWLDVLATALFNGGAILIVGAVLVRFDSIAGWSALDIAFLYGVVETSFGLMDMLFSGFDPPWFSSLVRSGKFDQLLLRPTHVWTQVLGSTFLLRRIGRIAQGAAVLVAAIALNDVHWTAAKAAYLPFVIAGQVSCFGSLFVIGSTITFWTKEQIEAINILTYGGVEMTTYPMSIYPDWLRRFFTFVVPMIFMNYAPALFFLDKPDPLGLPPFAPFITPFIGAAMLGVAALFWRIGLRRYQGAGS